MDIRKFLLEMIQFMTIVPAAVICYLPMKNQLKISPAKIKLSILGAICIFPCGSMASRDLRL